MNTPTMQREAVDLRRLVRRDLWNKCDVCGRIISYADLESGKAVHRMKTPDSEVSYETWETLCRDHYQPNNNKIMSNCHAAFSS
jgi:acetyl-CoA carboxylase beta subunit